MALVREQKKVVHCSIQALRTICLGLAVALISYILYADQIRLFSIGMVWEKIKRFEYACHAQLMTVGFLPIYVALMVFGAAYLIHVLFRWIIRRDLAE